MHEAKFKYLGIMYNKNSTYSNDESKIYNILFNIHMLQGNLLKYKVDTRYYVYLQSLNF